MSHNNNKKEEKAISAAEAKTKSTAGKQEKSVTIKEEEYKQLQETSSKVKEYQDKCLRLQADFENARKRIEKQCQDVAKYANEGIILELLTILDDLERTVQVAENKNADLPTFLKGIEMILAHLYEMLKENGLKPIEVKDKIFDPHTSEALMQVESSLPENTVIEELQKGYFLNDRVIRTAKVKVSKKIERIKTTNGQCHNDE